MMRFVLFCHLLAVTLIAQGISREMGTIATDIHENNDLTDYAMYAPASGETAPSTAKSRSDIAAASAVNPQHADPMLPLMHLSRNGCSIGIPHRGIFSIAVYNGQGQLLLRQTKMYTAGRYDFYYEDPVESGTIKIIVLNLTGRSCLLQRTCVL